MKKTALLFNRRVRHFLGLGTAITAIAAGGSAHAQTVPAAAAPANPTGGEIVVTAQFRSQSLQQVPISISAVSSEQLRLSGANNLKDLQYAIPNVTFAGESFAGNPKVVIRGLYINTRTIGLEPSFGVYVDGVFQGRPIAYNLDLVDTERVEYLRGPQGSLYGKNTISGAINVITQAPGDHLQGYVTGDYGNYNYNRIAGTLRGPITDTLGFKITGFRIQRDGIYKNIGPSNDYGAEKRFGGGAELRYNPDDRFEVIVRADGLKEDRSIYLGEASNVALAGSPPFNAAGNLAFGAGLSSQFANATGSNDISEPYKMDVDAPSFERRRIYGTSGTINYKIGDFTISSITAYRHASDTWGADDDYSPFDISRVLSSKGSFNQFTQELRLTSPARDRFNYVIGAFYYGSDLYQDRHERTGDGSQQLTAAQRTFLQTTPYGTPAVAGIRTLYDYYEAAQRDDRYDQYARANIKSYALYGQANFRLLDHLTLTGGLRYSIEQKIATYQEDASRGGVPITVTNTTSTLFGNTGRYIPLIETPRYTDKKLTPSATIKYDLTDAINIFGRYARGFKGTGFNFGNGVGTGIPSTVRGVPGSLVLLPERIDSFEAGIKAQFFDRKLTANATYFYEEGKNLQISAFLPDLTRPSFNTNANIQGFELELAATPIQPLRLAFNVGYTDVICVGGGAAASVAGASRFNATCTKGVDLENVSKWNISGNATLSQPVSPDVTLVAFASAFYRTRFLGGSYYVNGYAKVDGRVGVKFSNGIGAYVWGQNLFNKVSIGNSFGSSARGAALPTGNYDFVETFDMPRTYGVSVEYRF